MAGIRDILDLPIMYRIWQLPFAYQKMGPVRTDLSQPKATRVLDVGCGPGTNAKYFQHTDYRVLDINQRYIKNARQRYPGEFIQCDVRKYEPDDGQAFDYIFLNSFLHHIDDQNTQKILQCLHNLLTPDGSIHILDLVLRETDPLRDGWLRRTAEITPGHLNVGVRFSRMCLRPFIASPLQPEESESSSGAWCISKGPNKSREAVDE